VLLGSVRESVTVPVPEGSVTVPLFEAVAEGSDEVLLAVAVPLGKV